MFYEKFETQRGSDFPEVTQLVRDSRRNQNPCFFFPIIQAITSETISCKGRFKQQINARKLENK